MQQIKTINPLNNPTKRVLFLGYNQDQTKIIDALVNANCKVYHASKKVQSINFDLIISFGYKFVLSSNFLRLIKCPAINIHISYLPYNRGYHPNFWSFFENTPSGVTIHLIDDGIDTGPILFQKKVKFDRGEKTFHQTYIRLKQEAERLFFQNFEDILKNNWTEKKQGVGGSMHYKKDLPKGFSGWDSEIKTEITRLKKLIKKK